MIQIFYKFDKQNKLINHRLCYIPCPLEITPEEIEQFSIIGILEMIKEDNTEFLNRLKNSAQIRFDFDIKNCSNFHPASHFTILSDSCRIPVCAPIGPVSFIRFILENFYNIKHLEELEVDVRRIKKICETDYDLFDQTIDNIHKKIFHLNCNII